MSLPLKYTRVAMGLHWLVALLMITNVVLGLIPDYLPDAWVRTDIDTHKSIGITVFGLAILRLLWRLGHQPPPLPATFASWEHKASHAAHIGLYVLMFCLPLSGWLHDSAWKAAADHPLHLYGFVPFPRFGYFMALDPATKESMHSLFGLIHKSFAVLLYGLLFAHVAGALKHEWIDRESVLRRMWPGSGQTK